MQGQDNEHDNSKSFNKPLDPHDVEIFGKAVMAGTLRVGM